MAVDPTKDLAYAEIPTGDLPISDSATTIPTVSSALLPDPTNGDYQATIYNRRKSPGEAYRDGEAEIVLVTAESANDLTVTRAQAGTTAITFVDTIEWAVIAGFGTRILGQKADLGGDSEQTFDVAEATSGTHATRRSQTDQRVILPEGSGATNEARWYRIAQFSKSVRNSIILSVIGANRVLTTTSPDEIYISVENFNSTDPIIKHYTKNLTSGGNAGRVVVTDDGTNIGIYARVNRYGNATASTNHFIVDSTNIGTLEGEEIGQGSSVPAGISADVVYDTNSDSPDASMRLGEINAEGGAINNATIENSPIGQTSPAAGGFTELAAESFKSPFGAIQLSDDSVEVFDVRSPYGMIMISAWAVNGNYTGLFTYRAGSGGFCETVVQPSSNIETSTSILDGTTGTDGKVTISANSNGNVYIENRSGANRFFIVHFFGV